MQSFTHVVNQLDGFVACLVIRMPFSLHFGSNLV